MPLCRAPPKRSCSVVRLMMSPGCRSQVAPSTIVQTLAVARFSQAAILLDQGHAATGDEDIGREEPVGLVAAAMRYPRTGASPTGSIPLPCRALCWR